MPKNITIFTTPTCAYCPMVKQYLKNKNLSYDEVDLDAHPPQYHEENAQAHRCCPFHAGSMVDLRLVNVACAARNLQLLLDQFGINR